MRKIGLTGGIGSGKTTVSDLFFLLGIPIIDADIIAHQLTQGGHPTLEEIRQQFGDDILFPDGELNRRKLREEVFDAPGKLRQLEKILHPQIKAEILQQVTALESTNTPYCIIAIPLILESGMLDLVDELIVVDIPEELQLERVGQRDNTSKTHVRKIIRQQASRSDRLHAANHVIDNSGSPSATFEQVKRIDKILRQR